MEVFVLIIILFFNVSISYLLGDKIVRKMIENGHSQVGSGMAGIFLGSLFFALIIVGEFVVFYGFAFRR
jgi:hypothetical protein